MEERENIRVKNSFFEESMNALVKIGKWDDIPVEQGYWLSRIVKELRELNKDYMNERAKLVEKWGDRDSDGNLIAMSNGGVMLKDHFVEFKTDLEILQAIEAEIRFSKVRLPRSEIPKGLLNSFDMADLDPIIDFREEES